MIGVNRRRMMGGGGDFDWSKQYLTFEAVESGTFKNSLNVVYYSLDGGSTWISLAANTDTPTVLAGDMIMWKAELTPTQDDGVGTFTGSGEFNAMGNPMSLHYGDNFRNYTSSKTNAYRKLFYNSKIVSAENLKLIDISVGARYYHSMFYGCSSLIAAPEIPATSCGLDGCNSMFYGCTSLTVAPELHVTTTARYWAMYMFYGCTNLIQAPSVLPATDIGAGGYYHMFRNCSSLEVAPVIMATSSSGMSEMFRGCSKLRYIKAMFTETPNADNWVNGVASSGVFAKRSDATWENAFGVNAIPTGWTVETFQV